jgi:alpha-beta hydrolase superfamily lysophospholipase
LAVAGGVVGAAAFLAVTSVAVLTAVMARRVVTPPRKQPQVVWIRAVDASADVPTITLGRDPDAELPGRYGLWFDDGAGHARLGEILAETKATVTREVLAVDSGNLRAGIRGRLSGWFFLGPDDLGYANDDVTVETPVGPAPAWLIPAGEPSDRWVIQVHGRATRRQEALRAVAVFRDAGYNSLLVSYRNDGDAPTSLDGRYALGDTEWEDVDAAIDFARAHGARQVVLMGWSMGGAIALQTATRSGKSIAGVVLESPVIDWADVVAYQGASARLPAVVAPGAMRLLGSGWSGRLTGQGAPIDFARLDFVERAGELDLPILLMHSDDDGFVPSTGSRRLAERRPDIVTFLPFREARHTKLWNYDPEKWNGAITAWLEQL